MVIKKLISGIFIFVLSITELLSATQELSSSSAIIPYIQSGPLIPYPERPFPKNEMKFKIGFEFQEGSSLCPWAEKNYNIQKKPLIEFKDKQDGKVLFTVVIDTTDLEFVTEPFSDHESDRMLRCMESITDSIDILGKLIAVRQSGSVTFASWIDAMQKMQGSILSVLPTSTYSQWSEQLQNPFSVGESWDPVFQPQITIQHPLEYTIPLYFCLFGFEDPSCLMPFAASVPYRDLFVGQFQTAQKRPNAKTFAELIQTFRQCCQQKLAGLTFLHALTLVQMTPGDESDATFLKETLEMLEQYKQVDPKIRLTLMSRRPFSSMFADIATQKQDSYASFFLRFMSKNSGFMQEHNVPTLFFKANYAEQLFDRKTLGTKDLQNSLGQFDVSFSSENEKILRKLLIQGVISTAMIRNSTYKGLYEDYFRRVIESVDKPLGKRPIIREDEGAFSLAPEKSNSDMLSPPWFLERDNAMGFYKDGTKQIDKRYGEAVIEVRDIKNVQPWFLEKCNLGASQAGDYLKYPDMIKKHAIALFNFLYRFGSYINSRDGISEVYYLGLPFVLKNN